MRSISVKLVGTVCPACKAEKTKKDAGPKVNNPFRGARVKVSPPMRVLHRFEKPDGHWAEIRERTVRQFRAIEFSVFVDGSLLESQMFHNGREAE